MSSPRLSVVAAVFNASQYIESRLPVLLSQLPAVDGELILVDDGSSDDSLEIARRITLPEPRATILALEQNGGVAQARLAGVERASGDHIWFVDLDDEWEATLLPTLLSLAEEQDADIAVCGAAYVYPSGEVRSLHPTPPAGEMTGKEALEHLLNGRLKGHLWNKLISRDLIPSLQVKPSEVHSDLSMTASLLAAADRVIFTPEMMYSYLVRPGSIIQSGRQRFESLTVVEKTVREAAVRVGIAPALLEDFVHRFFLLSALKDSYNSRYTEAQARHIRKRTRARISIPLVFRSTMRSDRRRAAALLAVKFAPFTTRFVVRRM